MNIVLICLDTFRADMLRAAGRNDVVQTPNLDALTREGVLFRNAFGEGQPTIQFRRALVTGRRSFPWDRDYDTRGFWNYGRGWHKIPPEQDTLAERLLPRGVTTMMVADTYHMFKPTANFTRGMASWEFIRGQESDNWRSGPLDAIPLERHVDPESVPGNIARIAQYLLNQGERRSEDDYQTARVFRTAIRRLEENRDNQPFFFWIDSFCPHEPWDPPRPYADRYDPDWPEDWDPIAWWPRDISETTEALRRRTRALYLGLVTFVDKWVGHFLDKLEELRLADDTLVLVCSDHGTELWERGGIQKGAHDAEYRLNSEILFTMRLPGRAQAGRRVEALVQNQDIAPTLLAAMDVAHPPLDGVDLMPLVEGKVGEIRDAVVSGWGHNARVQSLDHAYTCRHEDEDPNERLYDVRADPDERADLSAERPDLVAACRSRLEAVLGQGIPAKPMDKTHPYKPPFATWLDNKPGPRPWDRHAGEKR